jgi:catechol 2,3-dioxygenase-like lactoylglutathione lyase family enzyme
MSDTRPQLQGAVLHVDSLDEAIPFYTELLELEVARRTEDAAVLATPAGTTVLAMRERRVQHTTDRTVQALFWRLPSLDALDGVERRLARLRATCTRHLLDEDELTLMSTWDPDGQRLVFVHHDGENDVPSSIPPEVFWY